MKKLWILLVGILIAVVAAGCSNDSEKKKVDISGNYVSPGAILEKIDNKETFTFAIVDKNCSACQAYKAGALKEIEEYKEGSIKYVEINGIDKDKVGVQDIQELISKHLDGKFEATPTTYFVKDGELGDVVVGAIKFEELKEMYEANEESANKDTETEANENNVDSDEKEEDVENN